MKKRTTPERNLETDNQKVSPKDLEEEKKEPIEFEEHKLHPNKSTGDS